MGQICPPFHGKYSIKLDCKWRKQGWRALDANNTGNFPHFHLQIHVENRTVINKWSGVAVSQFLQRGHFLYHSRQVLIQSLAGSKLNQFSVDQKCHQSELTDSMISSNGLCVVVLLKCTVFGQHSD